MISLAQQIHMSHTIKGETLVYIESTILQIELNLEVAFGSFKNLPKRITCLAISPISHIFS